MFNIYEKAPKNSKNCMKFFKISKELSTRTLLTYFLFDNNHKTCFPRKT